MIRRILPLLTALWLQYAPMLARLEPFTAPLAHPFALLLRWLACGTAVTGAFHAVSGATGLKVTAVTGVVPDGDPINATNGVAFNVRFQISSSQYGIPKTYTYEDLPPGVTRVSSKPDTLQGKPTRSGDYFTTVIGWEKANASGFQAVFSVLISVHGIPPKITQHPVSQSADVGGTVTFSVAATGEEPLTYQWLMEDLEIDGTDPTLILKNVTADSAGRYRVRVDSPAGSTFSDFATLSVKPVVAPPSILSQTGDLTLYLGETARLSVTVASGVGDPAPSVIWLKDDVALPGVSGTSLLLGPATTNSAGLYRAKVSGIGGVTLSTPIQVSVIARPVLAPAWDVTGLRVGFPAISGRDYTLEVQSAVGDAWSARQTLHPATDRVDVTEPFAGSGQFFRVRVIPLP